MEWIILITSAIGILYGLYQAYIAIVGSLKKLEPIPYAKPSRRIAAVIPARNEEKVVGLAVESFMKQRYPRDLFDVYVIPNNCTDGTEGAARRAGARILSCQEAVHSKGEVLRITFDKLLKDEQQYDAFVIIDADNIVDGGFLQATNNALMAGYQIGQAYRESKNPDDNWVTGCTSVFFWYMNRLFNHARAALGMSASLNGTGIMIGAKALRKMGYSTTSLTEDLELTAQCALAGERIAWMEEAITYDEQPLKLRDSFSQRRRWAAGTRQCAKKYLPALYKGARKSSACLDVAMLFSGVFMQVLGLVPGVLTVSMFIRGIIQDPVAGTKSAMIALAFALLVCLAVGALLTMLVCVLEGKRGRQRIVDALTMGWYLITWFCANLLGYLGRLPKWKAIPHTIELGIEDRECQDDPPLMPVEQKENPL